LPTQQGYIFRYIENLAILLPSYCADSTAPSNHRVIRRIKLRSNQLTTGAPFHSPCRISMMNFSRLRGVLPPMKRMTRP
jgi:hypothetical protein